VKCPQQEISKAVDGRHFSDWDDQVFWNMAFGSVTEISDAVKPERIRFYSDEALALGRE
jgi:hypothetical protein